MTATNSALGAAAAAAIDELQARLHNALRINVDLQKKADRAEQVERILEDLRGALEDALQENSELSDQVDSLERQVEELKGFEKEVHQARRLKAECESRIESEKAALVLEKAQLQERLDQERATRETAERRASSLEASQLQLQSHLAHLQYELEVARGVIEGTLGEERGARKAAQAALARAEDTLQLLFQSAGSLVAERGDALLTDPPTSSRPARLPVTTSAHVYPHASPIDSTPSFLRPTASSSLKAGHPPNVTATPSRRPAAPASTAARPSSAPLRSSLHLENVTGTFRRKGPHNLSDTTRAIFPRPARLSREGQIRTVLTSVEDELSVLSDRHAQLLREEQFLEDQAAAERAKSGANQPEVGTIERMVEVKTALAQVRESMAEKGKQVVQLTTVLHCLGATQ